MGIWRKDGVKWQAIEAAGRVVAAQLRHKLQIDCYLRNSSAVVWKLIDC